MRRLGRARTAAAPDAAAVRRARSDVLSRPPRSACGASTAPAASAPSGSTGCRRTSTCSRWGWPWRSCRWDPGARLDAPRRRARRTLARAVLGRRHPALLRVVTLGERRLEPRAYIRAVDVPPCGARCRRAVAAAPSGVQRLASQRRVAHPRLEAARVLRRGVVRHLLVAPAVHRASDEGAARAGIPREHGAPPDVRDSDGPRGRVDQLVRAGASGWCAGRRAALVDPVSSSGG